MYRICIIGSSEDLEQVRSMKEHLKNELNDRNVLVLIRDPENLDKEQEIFNTVGNEGDHDFDAWFWQLKSADLIIIAESIMGSSERDKKHAPITKMEIAAAVSYDVPILHAVYAADVITVIKADILNKARFERYAREQMHNQQYWLNMALNNAAGNFCSLGFNRFV